ncbi:Rho GTPase-activating protein 24 [Liparis tanakae]|uniref:Rho GTPase-activating protein 24 n=1 Tax=Liparis tanakae TaxID=230148 RepID=A0A4Z2GZA9_9TELE|nr:Rho GTPase-activating protein 24 [Liparis tanakae]
MHCIPTETPTTDSSCSTEPLYDNCLPFAQRGRAREREMESTAVCPAVTRPPEPCSSLPGRAPVVNEVPTVVGGGRGTGAWPDHSYCSWRGGLGRQDWDAEQGPCIINKVRGGRAGEWEGSWGSEDRAHLNQSEEHRSALSLYDNLPDAATPDSLPEADGMETRIQEHWQGQTCQAWAPEQIWGLMDSGGASEDKSTRIQEQNPDDDKKHGQDPELDSGASGFRQRDHLLLPTSPPQQHVTASSPQLAPAECSVLWPPAHDQHPGSPSWPPRAPPPVPLADPSASALRSLLTSFQQQIVRQREEYEARIISLEQRNEELQAEVLRLKANLTQQQHRYQAVQNKITQSERTRAAAELRNATLQKEMEQFFEPFGELNNEAKKTECIVKSF